MPRRPCARMKSAEEAGAPPARPGGENNSLPEPAKRLGLFRHVIEVRAGQCAAHGSGVGVKEHLDVTYQKQIFDLIDQWRQVPGRAVMAVVHDLNLARRYGTHALLLDRGHMAAAGEIGAVLTGNRLAEVYGMDVLGWLREMLRCWETPLTKN